MYVLGNSRQPLLLPSRILIFSRFCEPVASLPAMQGNNTKQNKSLLHEVSGVVTPIQAWVSPCEFSIALVTTFVSFFLCHPPLLVLQVETCPVTAATIQWPLAAATTGQAQSLKPGSPWLQQWLFFLPQTCGPRSFTYPDVWHPSFCSH